MGKKIALVGHCGPDSSYLRLLLNKASPGVEILMADDQQELESVLSAKPDLILFNREVGYGFDGESGTDLIRKVRSQFPDARTMLISNYSDAQAAALAEGALPGFGKREIGQPRVLEILKQALKS